MHHQTIDAFLALTPSPLAVGPAALVFAEDDVEVASTVEHLLDHGFATVVLFARPNVALPDDLTAPVHRIDWDRRHGPPLTDLVNRVIAAAPGAWLHYCYNAEYLFYPFCESRSIRDLLAFHTEERRDAMLTYVIDLYAADLGRFPTAVSLDEPWFDRNGYYAMGRANPAGGHAERQLDFHGGLRWRFEEHIPPDRRRIDRIGLFRAAPGLRLRDDHTFNIAEYNTYACPWHNNLTAAICSFRTAKALRANPGSRALIRGFHWHGSTPFHWHSQQLMDLGLIEPGQWF